MAALPGRAPSWRLLLAIPLLSAAAPTSPSLRLRADAAFPRPVAAGPEDLFPLSRLSPYFARGALAEAKAAFDAGAYPRALAALDEARPERLAHPELRRPARYLAALSLARAGLPLPAARELLALARDYPVLADSCRFEAAAAFEAAGEPRGAAAEYRRVSPGSPLHANALLGRGRALAAAGEPREALAVLAPLREAPAPVSGIGRDLGAAALLASAAIERRLGRPADAIRDEIEVWLRHPLYHEAEGARTAAERTAAALGRSVSRLAEANAAQLAARADLLLAAHRLDAARAAYAGLARRLPLGGKPSDLACRVHFGLGRTWRKLRRHARAIAELRGVADRCRGDADLRAKALYVLGSSASVVEPALGLRVYDALAEDFPDSSLADDALFFAADLELEAGRTDDARAAFRRVVDHYPDGDYAVETLFRLFWLSRAEGKPGAGLWALDAIEGKLAGERAVRRSEPLLRARYWRAETLAESLDPAERARGAALFAALARQAPFSYYGALASGKLPPGRPRAPDGEPRSGEPALHAGPLWADPRFLAGVELIRLGFPEEAASELAAVDRHRLTGEPVLLLAIGLERAGEPRLAHAIAKAALQLPDGAPAGDELRLWRVAYPLAYRPGIERWSAAAGVPADLVQALTREESALDPLAISGAGAVGLTQLMPATARRVARKLGLGPPPLTALLSADLNLRLGAAYLGGLLRRYHGSAPLALAAYNAGEGAVDRWLATLPRRQLDAFVEEIPIAETRGYVKRVLGTYATYRFLYGRGEDRWSRFGGPLTVK